jgi:hypothetical protein
MDKNVKVGMVQRSTEALLQLNASTTGSRQWRQYLGGISRVTFTILEQDPTKEAGQVEAFLSGNGGPVSSVWLFVNIQPDGNLFLLTGAGDAEIPHRGHVRAARAGALRVMILGPVRHFPGHRRARTAGLLAALLPRRAFRSTPLLP